MVAIDNIGYKFLLYNIYCIKKMYFGELCMKLLLLAKWTKFYLRISNWRYCNRRFVKSIFLCNMRHKPLVSIVIYTIVISTIMSASRAYSVCFPFDYKKTSLKLFLETLHTFWQIWTLLRQSIKRNLQWLYFLLQTSTAIDSFDLTSIEFLHSITK